MIKKIIKKIPYLYSCIIKIRKIKERSNALIIQSRYKKILKNIRKKETIKIAFFVTQKQLWCSQSIYDQFCELNIFEPVVISLPNGEDKTKDLQITAIENYNFFYAKNMNVQLGYNKGKYLNFNAINADIVFYDQPHPWLPKKLLWNQLSKKNVLVCYIPYGYKIANAYESHFNMPLQNSCWRVFAESEWHKQQFVKYGLMKGSNVVTSGYPKLDGYLEGPFVKNNKFWKYNIDEKKVKKIIWAPHWSIKDEMIGYSTFDENYLFFLNYAKKNKHISWIFKPHQRLRYYLEEIGFMNSQEIEAYYQEWENLSNGYYYNDSDYLEIFKTSDALITDCGSFLAEYLPTKNPVLSLVSKNSIGYNEVGKQLIDGYYKASNWEEIEFFIKNVVVNENDFLKKRRLSNLYLVLPNKQGAGKFIVKHIQKELVNYK